MQYMLLIYGDEKDWTSKPEAKLKEMYAAYGAYTKEPTEAGAMKAGSELAPVATASTVRVRNGKTVTTDGPFAETKEQLGGYYVIDVKDLDAAIRWAAKIPSAPFGS